jgi:hypothetical protein
MASLGDLVVGIRSDMKDFQKGLDGATNSVRGYTQKAGKFIEDHRREFLAFGAAITGALGMMTKQGVAYGVQLDKIAKTTQITTEEFSKLAYAAKQEHASIQSLEKGIMNLTTRIGYAADGLATYTRAFEGLGINIRDNEGALKTAYDVFLDLADVAEKGELSTKELSDMLQLLGMRSGKDLIPMLKLGREGLERMGMEAERLGAVMRGDTAAAFKGFEDTMTEVRTGMLGLSIIVAEALVPYLQRFAQALSGLISWLSGTKKETRQLLIVMTALSGLLLTLLGTLGFIVPVILKVNAGVKLLTGGVVSLGIALKALGIVGVAAFAWELGKRIGEIDAVSEALSGENGLFTRMFLSLDEGVRRMTPYARKVMDFLLFSKTGTRVDRTPREAPIELPRIDVPVEQKEEALETPKNLEAAWEGYEEFYRQMTAGLQVINENYELSSMMLFRQSINERMGLIQTYNNLWMQAHQGMHAFANMFIQNFHQGFSSAITSVITGTMKAKEAFKAFGEMIIQSIVNYLAQQATAWAITKALQGVMTAVHAGMAATYAAMWAKPAALASLASFGGNAGPAMAGIAKTVGFAQSIAVPALAEGGNIVQQGRVIVGERGPEILDLPQGARVTPLGRGDVTVNFYGDINTPVDLEEFTSDIGRSINNAQKAG